MSTKSQQLLVKEHWKEVPVKPARLVRRDCSYDFFTESMGALGFGQVTHREAIALPFPQENNLEDFRRSYWAAEMWSKFPFEFADIDREKAALQTFLDSESLCSDANKRLVDGWSKPIPERTRVLLKKARRSICRLLGDLGTDEVFGSVNWGPGASTSLRRAKSSLQQKWDAATHITFDATPALYHFRLFCSLGNLGGQHSVVPGNRITTVPKNAKTDRVIAIEPDWNMFFQKAVGKAIRRRLNKIGLLREDAWVNSQARNRDLARFGSETDTFGTIDLRGASDGISLALCELLLPSSWFRVLLALRSPEGTLPDGTRVLYEKISSMGNGFTFELETLLFWGLSTAVDEAGAICYGDDIVVASSDIGYRLIELLEFCGFRTNDKKTFLTGPFRESCGGHYFAGVDVTPPYVRKPVDSLPALITLGNTVTRVSSDDFAPFASISASIRERVPRRYWGPKSAGDSVLHSPFDACVPAWVPSLQCYAGIGLSGRVGRLGSPEKGSFIAALHGAQQGSQWESDHHDFFVESRWLAYPWSDG